MKTDKDTGAIICEKCGGTIHVRRISRVKGYPTKVFFKCPTEKRGKNDESIPCTGGFIPLMTRENILGLPNKTREYYKLKKPGEKLKKTRRKILKRK